MIKYRIEVCVLLICFYALVGLMIIQTGKAAWGLLGLIPLFALWGETERGDKVV